MKIIISGGGTGGHIYPALAIAEGLKKTYEDVDILYIGTKNSLESELAPKSGFRFKTIRVKSLPRKINMKLFISIKELLLGINDSKKIIKSFKPDVVIGTGGYVCGPIVYAAKKRNIPAIIHEQNAYPGITNKILSRYVDKVLVTFEDSKKYFKFPEKVVNTGNPIREEILSTNKKQAYKNLSIREDKPLVLSFGGSGGQKSLNENFYRIIKSNNINFQLIHVTGKTHYKDFVDKLKQEGIKTTDDIKILPYLHNMPEALNIADLIVTSAGAITLSEISAIGIPAILVPKSYTAENHQEYNARSFEKNGAAIVILERELKWDELINEIEVLLKDKDKLKKMSNNSKNMGKYDSTQLILKEIDKLIKKSN